MYIKFGKKKKKVLDILESPEDASKDRSVSSEVYHLDSHH